MRNRTLNYCFFCAVLLLMGAYYIFCWLIGSLNRDDFIFLLILIALWPWVTAYITTESQDQRTLRRRDRGQCVWCAYDLTRNESGFCPECGNPISCESSPYETAVVEPTPKSID